MSQSRGDLLVLFAALIWGVAFYFQKTAMAHIGPLLFVGLRGLLAAMALAPFALLEHKRAADSGRSVLPYALLGGLIFCLASAIQQYGLLTAQVINTGFLTAIYVVVTPFIYWLVRREPPSLTLWLAVALAALGVWTLGGAGLQPMSQGESLVALAAVFWAAHIVVTGEAARCNRPLTFTFGVFVVVAALGSVLALALEPIDWHRVLDAADALLYVGLLSSALTYGLMALALRSIPAPRATVLLSVEVLFSALAGWVLLGERLPAMGWLGGALIVLAVLLVRLRGVRAQEEIQID